MANQAVLDHYQLYPNSTPHYCTIQITHRGGQAGSLRSLSQVIERQGSRGITGITDVTGITAITVVRCHWATRITGFADIIAGYHVTAGILHQQRSKSWDLRGYDFTPGPISQCLHDYVHDKKTAFLGGIMSNSEFA